MMYNEVISSLVRKSRKVGGALKAIERDLTGGNWGDSSERTIRKSGVFLMF